MVFKKTLLALVFALPVVLGLPSKRALNPKCDFLVPITKDLLDNLFENECSDAAHRALRLIFHDTIGISPTVGGGGADGSILTFNETELTFPANDGIDDVLDTVGPFFQKYSHVLSPGDFVQLAGALSLVNCPGAPRVKFSLGRAQPKAASPPNLCDSILSRFGSVGFSPEEVIALLSSHSIAGLIRTPFDSTPSVFDTNIFIDVLLKGTLFPGTTGNQGEVMSAINGTIRLQSDSELARDPRTACTWQSFANNQPLMAAKFGPAVFKLSLLGQNVNKLTDCSDIIPEPKTLKDQASFPPGTSLRDIEQSVSLCYCSIPEPPCQPGPPLDVPLCNPQADGGDS
ncbi:manganese peroxidase [Gymnopilus junonius]|uniref:Peroxidase n=1 Tax=Gymnopilus junonius TaxID=109634 RepID=A0A9P5TKD3_GYMJU|nr:manganese peroxidase [Gymnopilus junonius]